MTEDKKTNTDSSKQEKGKKTNKPHGDKMDTNQKQKGSHGTKKSQTSTSTAANNASSSEKVQSSPRREKAFGKPQRAALASYSTTNLATSRSEPFDSPRTHPHYNKLSYRRLCMPSADPGRLRAREASFVLDAIPVEKRRTRFRDIIPKYDAADDAACYGYFQRHDVRNLMSVTCTLKPWERDVKL